MRTQEALKEILEKIREDEYKVPGGTDITGLALEMTEYIGTVDPELRDDLIYMTFLKWTVNDVFTQEQMRQLLNICTDDRHLFYRLGEKDTDSVFTRTFSVLFLPLGLYMDQQHAFLDKQELLNIKDRLLDYMRKEKDTRGYVEGKGWAHSIAHSSDALDEIAKSEFVGHDDLLEMLDIVKYKFSINNYTYINKEDERAVTAVMSILERKLLSSDELTGWIKSFEEAEKTGEYPVDQCLHTNIKGLLRSLYFRLLPLKDTQVLTDTILETLTKI